MKIIKVKTKFIDYKIYIENKLKINKDIITSNVSYDKIFILTQDNILNIYKNHDLFNSYSNVIVIKDGEDKKNINVVEKIILELMEQGCTRQSLIVGFGGGVVCDITGFVASIFMRGVDHVFVPTTLLAMVDASIGGKTGINNKYGKNIIGTFKQPNAIIIDLLFLKSLDKNQIINGMAEVIKYGLIKDETLFKEISDNFNDIVCLKDTTIFKKIIFKCCEIKAHIIMKDEYDLKERLTLNFGHTIGHAIESYYNYKISHGDAVYYGMLAESYISYKFKYLSKIDFNKICLFLHSINKTKLKNIDNKKILNYIKYDKKIKYGLNQFVLINKIGSTVIIKGVSNQLISEAVDFIK